MTNLKPDSPLLRRIVLSFLDFLNSVEPTSDSDAESLEVAKDCLSEVFKIDSSSTSSLPKSDSLIEIFKSQTGKNEIESDKNHEEPQADISHTSCTNNNVDTKIPGTSQSLNDTNKGDTGTIGVREREDELFGKFFNSLEKVHYFGTTPNGDDEQALDRATHLFHNALTEMKKSGSEEFDLKKLADTFKLQGNKAMQSKLYSGAIELYTIAIALCDDNAVYYCNRAAAYTQTNQHTEAIDDCHKAIEIDPNYSKAYSRLGFAYYAQGNYRDAIDKGFLKALQLDPNNESVRGNIQAAEQKLREEQQRANRGQNSNSTSHSNEDHSGGFARGSVPIPPFPSMPFNVNVNGQPFDMANMFRNMAQSGMGNPFPNSNSNSNSNEPGIRVGVNVGGEQMQMPEEILRSVFEVLSDGTTSRVNPQDNPNGN
ncbi:hypothetical protein Lser_V15G31238 [Lactuca serriola]